MVFDLTDKESFDHVAEWLREVDKHSQPDDTIRMLIGNKTDLPKDRQVSAEDIKNFTKATGIPVVETSAKLGSKIEDAFVTITKKLISLKAGKEKKEPHSGLKISEKETPKASGGCCSGGSV